MNPERAIREIMTARLITVFPETNAKEVYDIFRQHDFHHLPVIEHGGVLAGIISKEDFFKVSYILSLQTTGKTWSEKNYQSLKAQDFMTAFPMTLDPDDTIGLAADIFLANKFHALPVIEDEKLIGLVTTHDLLQYSFNSPYVEAAEEEEDEAEYPERSTWDDDSEIF